MYSHVIILSYKEDEATRGSNMSVLKPWALWAPLLLSESYLFHITGWQVVTVCGRCQSDILPLNYFAISPFSNMGSFHKETEWQHYHLYLCISISFFFLHHCQFIHLFFFLWPHLHHMKVPGPRVKSELQLRPMSHPQQCRIQAIAVTYTTACSNTGSVTY